MIHTLWSAICSNSLRPALASVLLSVLMVPSLSGCAVFAQIAGAIPNVEKPNYKNMANQSVAVMVWAEESGVRVEWPRIHLDLAGMVQSKLQKMQKEYKPDELKLTRFPVSAASVAKYQEEHPEIAAQSIEEVAPKLGVSRVIYIEIHVFQTRPDQANELFRGTMSGSVRVIEVVNGKGRETFNDDSIRVTYPRSSTDEGLPAIGDFAIYNGTLDGFAEEVCKKFLPHANDPDAEYGVDKPHEVGQ